MKIIDLYVKIANGEEVPKEIKVNDNIYHYDETDCNEFYRYRTMTNELLTDYADLNDEVEIIKVAPKEDKKIDKVSLLDVKTDYKLKDKLNEIIDFINKGE